ncbi:protein kinase domain-containing protein [Streptosporangium sp. DT93]|uniref:serine/threonine-protein kinase n=1 Tax=Streptosporangium sp. DT93 TaxID=3393428 RepID=UPI003CF4DCD3
MSFLRYDGLLLAGRYRLIAELGRGGMATVWRARDELLDREVAAKEVAIPLHLPGPEREILLERTMREARLAARLSHPNIAAVYDVVRTDGNPWIMLQFVKSRDLGEVIASDGPLPAPVVARIGLEVLSALEAAHAAGVVHRDVKPANILLTDDGRAVLTDFGLATAVDGEPSLTRTGMVVGTPAYIAPERAGGGASNAESDLWSLGATLYAAVEGDAPFGRSTVLATFTAVMTTTPGPYRHAGPLAPVIAGLLDKDPAVRTDAARAREQLQQVAALWDREHGAAPPWSRSQAPAPSSRDQDSAPPQDRDRDPAPPQDRDQDSTTPRDRDHDPATPQNRQQGSATPRDRVQSPAASWDQETGAAEIPFHTGAVAVPITPRDTTGHPAPGPATAPPPGPAPHPGPVSASPPAPTPGSPTGPAPSLSSTGHRLAGADERPWPPPARRRVLGYRWLSAGAAALLAGVLVTAGVLTSAWWNDEPGRPGQVTPSSTDSTVKFRLDHTTEARTATGERSISGRRTRSTSGPRPTSVPTSAPRVRSTPTPRTRSTSVPSERSTSVPRERATSAPRPTGAGSGATEPAAAPTTGDPAPKPGNENGGGNGNTNNGNGNNGGNNGNGNGRKG